jgi:hypothetical protein
MSAMTLVRASGWRLNIAAERKDEVRILDIFGGAASVQ